VVFCYNRDMEEKDTPKEYENLTSEDISQQLENITNKETEKKNKLHVRTFARDVAEQMKTNSASVVKIALAEQNRQKEYETIVKDNKKQQIIFLIATFIFVVGGSALLAFSLNNKESTTPIPEITTQAPKANSIVFSEQQEIVDVTNFSRAEMIQTILSRVGFIKEAGITNIITILKNETSPRTMYGPEFISMIAVNLPETTIPLIENNFMIGVDGDNDFSIFVIFSFKNFDAFVDGFREWEPFLVQDMNRLLAINTSGQGIEVFSKSFQSEILFNKESRVLRDQNQGFVVGYTFLDRNNVVISTNIETIQEVINRYNIQGIQ